jgi:hypothetical protein
MRKCGYCGRENDEAALHCVECGTGLSAPLVSVKPASPRDWTWLEWLRYLLTCLATVLFFGLIYLLSFGPVAAYCCKTTSRTTTTTVNGTNTVTTIVHTVRIPRSVGVVYYPAMLLRGSGDPTGLYRRYIEWWANRQSPH